MKENSRKKRIESILRKNFSPTILLVRDDSKKHEGHSEVSRSVKETHFFVKMVLNNYTITTPSFTAYEYVHRLMAIVPIANFFDLAGAGSMC